MFGTLPEVLPSFKGLRHIFGILSSSLVKPSLLLMALFILTDLSPIASKELESSYEQFSF